MKTFGYYLITDPGKKIIFKNISTNKIDAIGAFSRREGLPFKLFLRKYEVIQL
jgi:hypothetical protein